METLKNKFRNLSIFTKISVITSVVIIVISLFSTLFLVKDYSREILNRDCLLVEETANKIYDFFGKCYNNIYNQRTLIHSTDHISDILDETRDNPAEVYELNTLKKITDYMKALAYADTSIDDVIIFTSDGENALSYTSGTTHNIYSGYDFNQLPYIKELRSSDKSIAVVYDDRPGYLSSSSSNSPEPVLSFIVKIYTQLENNSENPLGYMILNYSPEIIDSEYENLTSASNGNYYVINSQSDIIYSNDKDAIGTKANFESSSNDEVLFNMKIGLSGIKVIGILSSEKLRETTFSIVINAILITGVGILFIIMIILLLHRIFIHKFRTLANAMSKLSVGDFSIELPVNSSDEIGYLSETFNRMSKTLNEYIDKTYLAETERRTAELYALQAQINPHFLANTIESIRMSAVENDDYCTSNMLKDLGNLFRWMIRFDDDIIDIESELNYIDCYLELMKFRFEDKLIVNLDVPQEIYSLGIPRFTLQPIFENAISHGVSPSHVLIISSRLFIEDEILTIIVEDNGPGINEEDLLRLRQHISSDCTYKEFGIALRNINTRIKLLFGPQYGLTVESRYSFGTTITVTFPAKEKKELKEYVQTTYRG